MNIAWGIFLTVLSFLAWAGQVVTVLSPNVASKLGLTETDSEVDRTFAADIRAEAIWDSFILWILPVAGILLALGHLWWVYFGLVGGSMYLYFAGRGIVQRSVMIRRGVQIGTPTNIKVAFVFNSLWGVSAIITIILALKAML